MTYSSNSSSQLISGTAAGVPFTVLPPRDDAADAPLVVVWHLMDPPCTDSAMAAALPMAAVPAWRLYLGLPLTGRRLPAGGFEELMRLGYADGVLNLLGPILSQAADEAPAAVAAVRTELNIADRPIGVAGGSLGGAVALEVIARAALPISAAALVNPMVRMAGGVAANERRFDFRYEWTDASRAVADRFDFLRRAAEIATVTPALLLVSGEGDDPELRTDTEALGRELTSRYRDPSRIRFQNVPGMPHHLAEPPGVEPSPQNAHAVAVDAAFTRWFAEHLCAPAASPAGQ
ncbi:MAG TPA: prolyl oligopeptidase family serine peptidase [Pseudonocardiaceae bacterium]